MSVKHILSAWSLPTNIDVSEFADKPLRAEAAFELSSEAGHYLLFSFPMNRQESIMQAVNRAKRAHENGVFSVMPILTVRQELGHTDGDAFWVLYPHHGQSLIATDLLDDMSTAIKLGQQFADLPKCFPVSETEYPPSNLFSPKFQESLLTLITEDHDLELILDVVQYLRRNFEAVLPWMEQEFVHGDLHPGNMFVSQKKVLFHDWEYARRELCLYDALFLIGCLGLESAPVLTSEWTLTFLRATAASRPVTQLTAENAFSVMLCTRLHWLHLWLSLGDQALVVQEQHYLHTLLNLADEVKAAWLAVLTIQKPTQKWVVTDAVLPPHIKTWLMSNSLDNVEGLPVEDWPMMMVALGKENQLSSMICWIDQLVDDWFQGESKLPLPVLTQMMANLSLDLARHLQQAGLYRIKAMLGWMAEEVPDESSEKAVIKIAQSYIQRNLSVTLGELGQSMASFNEIEVLEELWQESEANVAIAEELSRGYAGGMVTAQCVGEKEKAKYYFQRLEVLQAAFPASDKIRGAYQISLKQYER